MEAFGGNCTYKIAPGDTLYKCTTLLFSLRPVLHRLTTNGGAIIIYYANGNISVVINKGSDVGCGVDICHGHGYPARVNHQLLHFMVGGSYAVVNFRRAIVAATANNKYVFTAMDEKVVIIMINGNSSYNGEGGEGKDDSYDGSPFVEVEEEDAKTTTAVAAATTTTM
jgi:hypothetical protein